MSRTKKVIKNGKIGTFFFVLTTLIGFYSRSVFLGKIGAEFIGLVATLNSFIGFLNLIELGVGTSMGFAMYQSLFKKNYDRINELFSLIGYLYDKIGKIVLILGVILSLFFPIIFRDTQIDIGVVYYVFYVYLLSTLLNYFFNYHVLLIQADQKGYITTSYKQILHILKIIIQVIILFYSTKFVIFVTVELISSLVFNFLIYRRIEKEYPWLLHVKAKNSLLLKKNKDIVLKIKQVFVHRISSFILKSTDSIIIFSFVNLQSVTYVNNYYIIIGSATTLINNFLSGTGAAVGSIVAEKNKEKTNKIFWELMSLNHYVAGILVLFLFYGINPVIKLWLGATYILDPQIIILLLANMFIMKVRVPMDEFINAYGMFHDTWAPIVEGVLNLTLSIVLAKHFGIVGVLIGTFVSVTLIALVWKPYFLFKYGFKEKVLNYWRGFFRLIISFGMSFFICDYLVNMIFELTSESWFLTLFKLFQIGVFVAVIFTSITYLINPGFRVLVKRLYNLANSKISF